MKKIPKFKSFKERIEFYFEDVDTFPGWITDIVIVFLIVTFSVIYVILTYPLPELLRIILEGIDTAIMVVFTVEYLLRF